MTMTRRKARSSMGSRTSRRQSTKHGAAVIVAGKKVRIRKPRSRSKIERIMRGEKV